MAYNSKFSGQKVDDLLTQVDDAKLASSDEILTYTDAGLKAELSVQVDGNNVKILGKNDSEGNPIVVAEFSVLQSQIIDNVYIENGHLYIVFVVDSEEGTETVDVDLSELLIAYVGSAFININGQTISLNYNALSDQLVNDGFVKSGNYLQLPVFLQSDLHGTNGSEYFDQMHALAVANQPFVFSATPGANYVCPSRITFTDEQIILFYGSTTQLLATTISRPIDSTTVTVTTATYTVVLQNTTQSISGNKDFTGDLLYKGTEVATKSDIPRDFVNISETQVIYGAKTFENTTNFSGAVTMTGTSTYKGNEFATINQTPQFGTTRVITSLSGGAINLNNVYDMRFTYSGAEGTINLSGFLGNRDGGEWILTVINNGTGDITYNFTNLNDEFNQWDEDAWTIPQGRIGELSIRQIGANLVYRIIGS